jgi:chromosomal replication initiation ATPase DnaA
MAMAGFDNEPEPRPATQIPLDLPIEPRHGLADFLVSPANSKALSMVLQWPDWPSASMLLLGPPGAGKTHLLSIWAERAQALAVAPNGILSVPQLAATQRRAFALDGVDLVADETALFHFLNFVSEAGVSLLMSARRAPSGSHIRLPDLLSRLRRAPMVEIGAPDDELILAVLEKLFRDRQLSVDRPLLEYIALRLERSLDAARRFVSALDREALARGRPVTRVLAGELLERLEDG